MEWSEKRYWKLYLLGTLLMVAAFPFGNIGLGILWVYWPLWSVGLGMTLYCYWRAFWARKLKKAERRRM